MKKAWLLTILLATTGMLYSDEEHNPYSRLGYGVAGVMSGLMFVDQLTCLYSYYGHLGVSRQPTEQSVTMMEDDFAEKSLQYYVGFFFPNFIGSQLIDIKNSGYNGRGFLIVMCSGFWATIAKRCWDGFWAQSEHHQHKEQPKK